jgi:hypothetical protein
VKKYSEFAERMRLRLKRDVTDPLGNDLKILGPLYLSPGSISKRKKRTYEEAFGQEPPNSIELLAKKRLLESKQVVDCATTVEDYNIAIETAKA